MGLTEQIAGMMIDGLDEREKMDLVLRLADHLMSSLRPDDRVELMRELIPSMLERTFADLPPEERVAFVRSVMPRVMDLLMEAPFRPSRQP